MENIGGELGSYLISQGPIGVLALIMTGLYVYERVGRGKDRERFDAALKDLQEKNVETLKTVIPLAQKFTTTMDTVFPLVMKTHNRREG